jgi:hypothetical protein
MIHCLNTRQLQGYIEDPAALHDREFIQRHLFECDRCRGALDRLGATSFRVDTWLATLSRVEKGEIDAQRALARLEAALDRCPPPLLAPAGFRPGRSVFATWLLVKFQ